MNSFHALYRKVKYLPIIGPIVRSARALYHHPYIETRRLVARDRAAAHEALTQLYGPESDAHRHLEFFVSSPLFSRSFSVGHSGDFDVMMLYSLVRMQKPEFVIETGVASGRSSMTILSALRDNEKGRLYSVDLPQFYASETPESFTTSEGNQELRGFVPEGKQPGWLVPDELRSRWELILGDSNEELPKLFARIPNIDMFYHDGDHSYSTMKFELQEAWGRLPGGGLLLSDDVDWNNAWKEFVDIKKPHDVHVYRHFGIARKEATSA